MSRHSSAPRQLAKKSAKGDVYRIHTPRYAHIQYPTKETKRRITKESRPFTSTIRGEIMIATEPLQLSETVVGVEQKLQRNIAVDAYRGFVMLLMMAEVLQSSRVALSYPNSLIWRILAFNQTHTEWVGMSLHDTIQPSFTFLVGVALPYSVRSRQKKGATFERMLGHTIWRSFLLVALGIFLRSTQGPITYFTFEDTLTQIGLGYTFAFLLTFVRTSWQWTAFAGILFAYWLAWRSIRRVAPTSTTPPSVYRTTGASISSPVSHRTGIRTATSARLSISGF
jgi:hypothetical protein